MRYIYLFSLCFILPTSLVAQTKLIAHKSHSGGTAKFNMAYTNNLFDVQSSDFGIAPRPFVYNVCLDSVVHVSDSVSILFTSHCNSQGRVSPQQNWKPGADTAKHHHLFSGDYSVEEIKYELEYNYGFDNDVETVKFIGFDDFRKTENSLLPIVPSNPKNRPPFGNQPLYLIVGLVCLSAIAGLASYRYQAHSIS